MRKLIFITCIILGVLCPSSFIGQASTTNSQDQPTPVQPGNMTATEKAHSKLYQESGIGEDLDAKTRITGQDVDLYAMPPEIFLNPNSTSLDEFLAKRVCGVDAVIVGTVQSLSSQLTENHKWVFSELSVWVDQVVKDNPQANIVEGATLAITRSGGTILLNKRKVDAQTPGGHLFRNISYLFFLKYLPDTNSYAVDRVDGVLQVQNRKLSPLPGIQDKTFDSIDLTQLTSLASTSCAA